MQLWFGWALISAVLSAIAAVLEKEVVKKHPVGVFVLVMAWGNLLFSLPFLFWLPTVKLTAVSYLVVGLKSLLQAGSFSCILIAFTKTAISRSLPIMAATPGIVALGSLAIFGENLSLAQWAGLMVIMVGSYLLQLKPGSGWAEPIKVLVKHKAIRWMVLALLLSSTTSLIDKAALTNQKIPVMSYTFYESCFQAVIYSLAFGGLLVARKVKWSQIRPVWGWSLLMILGVSLATVGWRYTQFSAVKLAPVALVISVKRLSVLMAAAAGGMLFKEKHLAIRIIATMLLLGGAFLVGANGG